MKRLLALDYGRKHIGVAFTESQIAQPLNSIKYNNKDELMEILEKLIKDRSPEEIIVGMPEGILVREVEEFAQNLRNYRLPVILHPETLTTQEALDKLRQVGAKRSKLKQEHSYAASLILEDYLDSQNSI